MEGAGGSGAEAVSIGNYKGVMLCNRPLAGSVADQPASFASEPAAARSHSGPYRAGILQEAVNPRGYDPSALERMVIICVAWCEVVQSVCLRLCLSCVFLFCVRMHAL